MSSKFFILVIVVFLHCSKYFTQISYITAFIIPCFLQIFASLFIKNSEIIYNLCIITTVSKIFRCQCYFFFKFIFIYFERQIENK